MAAGFIHIVSRCTLGQRVIVGISLLVLLIPLDARFVVGSSPTPGAALSTDTEPDSVVLNYLKSRAGESLFNSSVQSDSILLNRLDLDWSIRPWNHRSGQGVVVARSPAESWFVLIGVGYGEFGPGGDCRYCLVDSLGHRRWIRDGRMFDLPQVSDVGEVVLFELGDRVENTWSLTVRWLLSDGTVTGEQTFGPLGPRVMQRSLSNEIQFLDEGTRRVYFTINEPPASGDSTTVSSLGEINNVRLIAMSSAGVVEWNYRLGGMGANFMQMAAKGSRILIDDLNESSVSFANVLIVLTSEGQLVRRTVLEKSLGGWHPVVERNDRYLLLANGALYRMNLDSGETSPVGESDWLDKQAEEWRADSRRDLATHRLQQLEQLKSSLEAQARADWPTFYRRWGRREGRQ